MSPRLSVQGVPGCCFPRVSGDEPGVLAMLLAAYEFSPRERG